MIKPVVRVYHNRDGSWVDSPCTCFGGPLRAHSTLDCAFEQYREKHPEDTQPFEQIDFDENPEYIALQKKLKRTKQYVQRERT